MDMSIDQKAVRLLEEAHALLNHGGRRWIKGSYSNLDESLGKYVFCSAGALYQASGSYGTQYGPISPKFESITALERARILDRAMRILGDVVKRDEDKAGLGAIVDFNDAAKTTWEQVSDGFQRAIQQLRQR